MADQKSVTVRIQVPVFSENHHYQTVEKAITYLQEHSDDQPTLADLANHVGMSPHHLIEVFQKWAGITPKQLLKVLTLSKAKQLLHQSFSNFETSMQCGLSGTGRLHDLFVTIDAVSPGEFKSGGVGVHMQWGLHETPFGKCLAVVTHRGLSHLFFPDEEPPQELVEQLKRSWNQASIEENSSATKPFIDQIFYGTRTNQPLRMILKGTPFQVKVWRALLEIPNGNTTAYSALAKEVGRPAAHRACASAVGDNPISYLIPCHRVLRKNLELGGYRWGLARKTAMLSIEQDIAGNA